MNTSRVRQLHRTSFATRACQRPCVAQHIQAYWSSADSGRHRVRERKAAVYDCAPGSMAATCDRTLVPRRSPAPGTGTCGAAALRAPAVRPTWALSATCPPCVSVLGTPSVAACADAGRGGGGGGGGGDDACSTAAENTCRKPEGPRPPPGPVCGAVNEAPRARDGSKAAGEPHAAAPTVADRGSTAAPGGGGAGSSAGAGMEGPAALPVLPSEGVLARPPLRGSCSRSRKESLSRSPRLAEASPLLLHALPPQPPLPPSVGGVRVPQRLPGIGIRAIPAAQLVRPLRDSTLPPRARPTSTAATPSAAAWSRPAKATGEARAEGAAT
jgi:hypothetical protein